MKRQIKRDKKKRYRKRKKIKKGVRKPEGLLLKHTPILIKK